MPYYLIKDVNFTSLLCSTGGTEAFSQVDQIKCANTFEHVKPNEAQEKLSFVVHLRSNSLALERHEVNVHKSKS